MTYDDITHRDIFAKIVELGCHRDAFMEQWVESNDVELTVDDSPWRDEHAALAKELDVYIEANQKIKRRDEKIRRRERKHAPSQRQTQSWVGYALVDVIGRVGFVMGCLYLLAGAVIAWSNPELLTWSNFGWFVAAWVIFIMVVGAVLSVVFWILDPLFNRAQT